jgi:hypothetical protein
MRTTLTLDDDVADKLRRLAERRGASFKETVNDTLRKGLSAQDRKANRPTPFCVAVFRSAFRPGVDPMRLSKLSDDLEVEHAVSRIRNEGP